MGDDDAVRQIEMITQQYNAVKTSSRVCMEFVTNTQDSQRMVTTDLAPTAYVWN